MCGVREGDHILRFYSQALTGERSHDGRPTVLRCHEKPSCCITQKRKRKKVKRKNIFIRDVIQLIIRRFTKLYGYRTIMVSMTR